MTHEVGLNLLQDSIFLALGNGQVRDDVAELATEWRGLGPSMGDRLRELPELRVRLGNEIQHLGEPPTALEPNIKGPVALQHLIDSRAHGSIDVALFEEREEHGDMRWNTRSG